MSSSTSDGASRSTTRSASRPSEAVSTGYPSRSRISRTVCRIEASSSTTRIGLSAMHRSDSLGRGVHHRVQRQRDVEGAALADLAGRPDPTAMLLHDAATDVQAQPHAREPAIVDVAAAVEALEQPRQILARYPDALVGHAHPGYFPLAP